MNTIDFQGCIKSLKEAEISVKNFSEEIPKKFGPEICETVIPAVNSAISSIRKINVEVIEIEKIYQIKQEIQSQILNPVTETINSSSQQAIKSINESGETSIEATKKWAIYAIFLSMIFGIFLDRVGGSLKKLMFSLYAPTISYQVGSWNSLDEPIIDAAGKYLKPINGDYSEIARLAINASSSMRINQFLITAEGSNFVIKDLFLFPESDFSISCGGNAGVPNLVYHPFAINEKFLGFDLNKGSISRVNDRGAIGYFVSLLNPKKKSKIRFRVFVSVYVDSFRLGLMGRIFGSHEFSFQEDFEFDFGVQKTASGSYKLL